MSVITEQLKCKCKIYKTLFFFLSTSNDSLCFQYRGSPTDRRKVPNKEMRPIDSPLMLSQLSGDSPVSAILHL
uniref:Uncharacterized protein n=1 Tax=Oreochromis aureus TaxID=47969 RepID=A0AAZ1X5X2_OREAU